MSRCANGTQSPSTLIRGRIHGGGALALQTHPFAADLSAREVNPVVADGLHAHADTALACMMLETINRGNEPLQSDAARPA